MSGMFEFLDSLGTSVTGLAGKAVDVYGQIRTADAAAAARVADQTPVGSAATLSGNVAIGGNTLLWVGLAVLLGVGALVVLRR